MFCLAIETSCDETAAAVVRDGQEVLSNVIASQIEFHKKYGGIVPEVASRLHAETISPIILEALTRAGKELSEIDAVAVTFGPGLVGSLIVGVSAAKALAWAIKKPLIGVNHLEGHIYANFLTPIPQSQVLSFPFICLLVSGGHTSLVLVRGHGNYETIGRTRDDAAGEAYDKVARFLKIGYPGGPIIDKLAKEGNPKAIQFKRPMIEEEFGLDFSFSGLKTAVVNFVNKAGGTENLFSGGTRLVDLCASFQAAVVDVLVEKSLKAAKQHHCQTIALAGGVSANSALRQELKAKAEAKGIVVHIPPLEYCTDNAAMIACAGYYKSINSSFSLAPIASARI
ncbi:tRNA (adenosine(37)-N6)-threonylcarbamoyltransferase complex transferase subunit TsaD [candidate division WOR-1 bacterium RIFOXYA12_FULL_52_29]|uniref:tRNA N6-adenosine threonylcarbamoyltransferase n=1 Tax=candidate division WOR-1 bacterium RIFOXYC12_FULL_54_18 TaxID=1802584 RepID=A0A1F4T5U6_UNCSA|nr:MAG: tRNA (adenosine(37)-N6)-threonylcarbamoyltransferase complex transferase subunit TsaD [candidate division WOR-1 bacterium RIFOXYA2_FULL_51_19]OGC17748.1 MAG: tRNA (adenosine(37)-N6)-threonylcarbamoyltransferase complex transferase subunit TsaD [candidate division WOR-1 bacterium RIFOXYA12_FULL_52_29]OGC26605.1 MAG: tRNA (adenosine(37)-N6)-threonylcarbamoyltransferase complex transferase subunit TsaD [candidate division WOR-1 bacterium RIFOXYB2_FULL_45_9]OGC28165.1 MAG: tRNA (adenosine(37